MATFTARTQSLLTRRTYDNYRTILKQDKDSLSYYKTKNASQGSNTFGFCKEYKLETLFENQYKLLGLRFYNRGRKGKFRASFEEELLK